MNSKNYQTITIITTITTMITIINLTDIVNLKRSDKYVALSNLSMFYA